MTETCRTAIAKWEEIIDTHEGLHVQDAQAIATAFDKQWRKPQRFEGCGATEAAATKALVTTVSDAITKLSADIKGIRG